MTNNENLSALDLDEWAWEIQQKRTSTAPSPKKCRDCPLFDKLSSECSKRLNPSNCLLGKKATERLPRRQLFHRP